MPNPEKPQQKKQPNKKDESFENPDTQASPRPDTGPTASDETSGTPEQAWEAADRFAAGPERNDHPTHVEHPIERTGRHATDDWKKGKPQESR